MPKRFPLSIFLAAVTLAAAACSSGDSTEETTLSTTPATTTTVVETTTSAAETTTTTVAATTTTTTTTTADGVTVAIAVSYADGEVGGPEQSEVAEGSLVQILVTSDVEDQVSLEGYDIEADVGPDTAAVLEFVADTIGTFDLELHDEEVVLLELEVR